MRKSFTYTNLFVLGFAVWTIGYSLYFQWEFETRWFLLCEFFKSMSAYLMLVSINLVFFIFLTKEKLKAHQFNTTGYFTGALASSFAMLATHHNVVGYIASVKKEYGTFHAAVDVSENLYYTASFIIVICLVIVFYISLHLDRYRQNLDNPQNVMQ